jgi:hypothetical protein
MDKKCTAVGCKDGKVALLIGFADCKECNGTGVIASETTYSEDLDVNITDCTITKTETDPITYPSNHFFYSGYIPSSGI